MGTKRDKSRNVLDWGVIGGVEYGMETWSKLFSSIIDSSVWLESKETRLVWVTMLAKKDGDGFVRGNVGTLARDAGVTFDEAVEAIRRLESPDASSRTKTDDGRRIRPVDGGWIVINHFVYRDEIGKVALREYWRKKKERQRKKSKPTAESAVVRAMENHGDEVADQIQNEELERITGGTGTGSRKAKGKAKSGVEEVFNGAPEGLGERFPDEEKGA